MKILLVSQHFYPDEFRVNDVAATLVEQGHKVTVLTSLPDYKTGKCPKEYRWFRNRRSNYKGVEIIRCFSFSRRKGFVFRTLNYISFLVSSTFKALLLKEKFDISMCYQTSPVLMANAAKALAKKQKIPFFLYCLDLWPECLKAWNVGENSIIFKLVHKYSTSMYNSADVLAVTSKPFIEYNHRVNKVPIEKFLYLPQHADDINLIKKIRISDDEPVVFAFGGNIGSIQNIECIIRAVYEIRDLDNFSVEIYGDGSNLEECILLSRELGIEDKIHFHGWVDKEQLWKEYENADAFLLTLKPQGYISQTVPAKLQEYMSGGRPIFASIDYASEIIEEAGCGVCVKPDDHISLGKEMRKFVENKGIMEGAAEGGRKYFLENYTKEIFIKKINEVFEKIVSKK